MTGSLPDLSYISRCCFLDATGGAIRDSTALRFFACELVVAKSLVENYCLGIVDCNEDLDVAGGC